MNIHHLLQNQIDALEPYETIPTFKEIKNNLILARELIQIQEIESKASAKPEKPEPIVEKKATQQNLDLQTPPPTQEPSTPKIRRKSRSTNHNQKELIQRVYKLANEKAVYLEDLHEQFGLGPQYIQNKMRLIEEEKFRFINQAQLGLINEAIEFLESQ